MKKMNLQEVLPPEFFLRCSYFSLLSACKTSSGKGNNFSPMRPPQLPHGIRAALDLCCLSYPSIPIKPSYVVSVCRRTHEKTPFSVRAEGGKGYSGKAAQSQCSKSNSFPSEGKFAAAAPSSRCPYGGTKQHAKTDKNAPSSRPAAAMKGIPKGLVPLAPSA